MLAVPAATGLLAAPPVDACGRGGEKGRGATVVAAPLWCGLDGNINRARLSLLKAYSSPQPALFEEWSSVAAQ